MLNTPSISKNAFYICGLTGGPYFPIPALIQNLSELSPILIGVKNSFEEKVSKNQKIPILYLPTAKLSSLTFKNKSVWKILILTIDLLKTSFILLYSSYICVWYLLKYQPVLIYSSGSFLAVPMIFTAKFLIWLDLLNATIVVHQQDPLVGLSNRLVSKKADVLSCVFDYTVKNSPDFINAKIIPNPILPEKYNDQHWVNRKLEMFVKNKTIYNEHNDFDQDSVSPENNEIDDTQKSKYTPPIPSFLADQGEIITKSISQKVLYLLGKKDKSDHSTDKNIVDTFEISKRPIKKLKYIRSSNKKPILLIFGGGSGARSINLWTMKNIDLLLKKFRVVHLTGILQDESLPLVRNLVQKQDYLRMESVFEDMPKLLKISDLVLCRAGLGSISELLFLKKPAFLVPIQNSHQELNAELVASKFFVLDPLGSDFWIDKINYYYPQYFDKIDYGNDRISDLQDYYNLLHKEIDNIF